MGNRAALSQYTEAEGVQIDNSASERTLRTVAIGRKNYLFAGSDAACRSAAVLYSVVGTCRRVGVEPFGCLQAVLTKLGSHRIDRLDGLLPSHSG